MKNLIPGIFGLLFGMAGFLTGLKALRNRGVVDRWPTTKGRVIERSVFQPKHAMLSVSAFRYSPLVKYTYQVDGKEFESNSILPSRIQLPRHSSKKWAQKQADSFTYEVTVHYNPTDPTEAYLVQVSKFALYFVLLAAGCAFLIGFLFLLVALNK
jgi:hypothetical protein